MSDLVRGHGGWGSTRHPATDNEWGSQAAGRHAINEDALLTPIFHALAHGGWRSRQPEPAQPQQAPAARQTPARQAPALQSVGSRQAQAPHAAARQQLADPVSEFERDPLTAPIPAQAFIPAPATPDRRRTSSHSAGEQRGETREPGRHHRRRSPFALYR
ncbi:hypothetical protein [Pseudonocardia sp. TRM90224]|uniref:hypothetical protein n=1 Tax=Pseudonocardia sp. TRM90224 TaxID=2812678 RepID=UPI001E2EAB96|nr:hypothetical protein [Pseudonocardia sp. TRM90224]